jgi:hypothetical protein
MEKFNFNTKLHMACLSDKLRPIMNCVHFYGGYAYATNGNFCVKQALSYHSIINPENLDGKSLHRENYKNILQFEVATANEDGIECRNEDGRVAFFEYFDRKKETVPDFDKIIKKFSAKSVDFIGFSPDQINIITSALYCPNGIVRISFGGVIGLMYVDVPGMEDQEAVLMPAIIEAAIEFPKE